MSVVSLNNVSIYQKKSLVLSEVSIEVSKGEFIYLIGSTGSGKSSLLKTLYGELQLNNGEGKIVGYDLKKIKSKEIPYLRRKLGIVFQDFQLLTDRTVNDNLKFVLEATGWKDKNQIQERVQNVLDKVKLGTKGFKMPHELSGGEQQRVAIARSLLNDPQVILADEPTGNLDPDTSEDIIKLLFEISNSGRAVIMATHNYFFLANYPSRTVSCNKGRVIEQA